MPKIDTWMPIYWGDYAKDTGHLGAVHHGAYLMLIKHYWTSGESLPLDDDQLWRIACTDSLAHWRKIRAVVVAFFEERDGRLYHERIQAEMAKAEGNAERRTESARRAAEARWEAERRAKGDAPRIASRIRKTMRDGCPPPSSSDNPHGITDTVAASALAPEGARSPIGNLPKSAQWAERLAGYRPWLGLRAWSPMWGPRPDSMQRNAIIPDPMLKAWLADRHTAFSCRHLPEIDPHNAKLGAASVHRPDSNAGSMRSNASGDESGSMPPKPLPGANP